VTGASFSFIGTSSAGPASAGPSGLASSAPSAGNTSSSSFFSGFGGGMLKMDVHSDSRSLNFSSHVA